MRDWIRRESGSASSRPPLRHLLGGGNICWPTEAAVHERFGPRQRTRRYQTKRRIRTLTASVPSRQLVARFDTHLILRTASPMRMLLTRHGFLALNLPAQVAGLARTASLAQAAGE